jgi:hypothetical protein
LQWKNVPNACSGKARHAICSGKTQFCIEKTVRVVRKNSSKLAVENVPNACSGKTRHATCGGKLDFAIENPARVVKKKQLAACSGKLCLIHAVKKRDTQFVVRGLDFAMEKRCV